MKRDIRQRASESGRDIASLKESVVHAQETSRYMNEKIFQVLREKVLNCVTERPLEHSQTVRGENQQNQCSTPPRKAKIVSAVHTRVIVLPNSHRLPDNTKHPESAQGADRGRQLASTNRRV